MIIFIIFIPSKHLGGWEAVLWPNFSAVHTFKNKNYEHRRIEFKFLVTLILSFMSYFATFVSYRTILFWSILAEVWHRTNNHWTILQRSLLSFSHTGIYKSQSFWEILLIISLVSLWSKYLGITRVYQFLAKLSRTRIILLVFSNRIFELSNSTNSDIQPNPWVMEGGRAQNAMNQWLSPTPLPHQTWKFSNLKY